MIKTHIRHHNLYLLFSEFVTKHFTMSLPQPHGVRCLGSCLGWMRQVAYTQLHGPRTAVRAGELYRCGMCSASFIFMTYLYTKREYMKLILLHWPTLCCAVLWDALDVCLLQRCLAMLVQCCASGSNMKMRWNACYAIGHLLQCPLPMAGGQEWLVIGGGRNDL